MVVVIVVVRRGKEGGLKEKDVVRGWVDKKDRREEEEEKTKTPARASQGQPGQRGRRVLA